MANPFGITQVDVPGLIGMYEQGKQARLSDMLMQRKLQQEDAASARQARVSDMIRNKAKPDEVMAEDFDTGAKYAEYLGKMDEQNRKRAVDQAGVLVNVGTSLSKIPAGPARLEAMRQAAPLLKQIGIPEEMLSQFDPNDDNALNTIVSSNRMLLGAGEQYTLSPGSARFDAYGNVIASQPFAPQYKTVGDGQTLVEVGGNDPFAPLIGAESNGRQFGPDGQPLTSPKGAVGIAQVMPDTGPEAAALAGLPWDPERYRNDPAYNEAIGRAYHAAQLADFGGDPVAAAAAYNAGPGRVRREQAKGGDWQSRLPQETRDYIAKVAPGYGGRARVIAQGAPKAGYQILSDQEASSLGLPAGTKYQRSPQGQITAVGGSNTNASSSRKSEADLRKEFNGLPEVKDFKDVRANWKQIEAIGTKKDATAQDDIALIFSYMKMLDPGSVVRESEFATAQNAAGVPDRIRNLWNRTLEGNRLNASQRANMVKTAADVYIQRRNTYNAKANEFRGYASDYGINADRVARQYVADGKKKPTSPAAKPTRTAVNPKTGERLGLINGQWVKM